MEPKYLSSSLQWPKSCYISAAKLIIFSDINSSISYIFLSVNAFICVSAPPPLNRSGAESRYSPLLGCWFAWHFLCIYELPLEKPAVKFRLTSIDFFVTSFSTTASLTCTSFLFSTFQMNLFFMSEFSLPSVPYATIAAKTTVTYKHTLKRPILMQYFPISVYNSHMEKGRTASLNNFYGFSYHLFPSYSNLDI
jgi:hypothetical protein